MDILYYTESEYGSIWWKGDTVITAIHENDANYRSEYMECLFGAFNITVEYIHPRSVPQWVKDSDDWKNIT